MLRARVRVALTRSDGWEEFTECLSMDSVLVRPRYSTVNAAEITGYAVALRPSLEELDEGKQPVWFSGGKLAPDLTLPRLRQRWTDPDDTGPARQDPGRPAEGNASGARPDGTSWLTEAERAAVWVATAAAVRDAQEALAAAAAAGRALDEDPEALAAATAAGEVLHAVSRLVEGKSGGAARTAAENYDRASRPSRRHSPPPTPTSRALRGAARGLLNARVVQRQEVRQAAPPPLVLEHLDHVTVHT